LFTVARPSDFVNKTTEVFQAGIETAAAIYRCGHSYGIRMRDQPRLAQSWREKAGIPLAARRKPERAERACFMVKEKGRSKIVLFY
jgi:hypothetical protein